MIVLLIPDEQVGVRILENPMFEDRKVVIKVDKLQFDEDFTMLTTEKEMREFMFKHRIDERHLLHPVVQRDMQRKSIEKKKEQEAIGKIHIRDNSKNGGEYSFCMRETKDSLLISSWQIRYYPRERLCNICYEHLYPKKREAELESLEQILPKRWYRQYKNHATQKTIKHPKFKPVEPKVKKMKVHIINPSTDKTFCQNERMDSPFIQISAIAGFPISDLCKNCQWRAWEVTHADTKGKPEKTQFPQRKK